MGSFVLLLCLLILARCELPGGENVLEVTSANWEKFVNDHQITLVEFYSSLCGACRKFAPDYAKVGDYLKGAITVARISLEDNRDKFQQLRVDTVPTVILFRPSQNKEIWKASFTRTPTAIVDWVVGLLPVLNLNSNNPDGLESFLKVESDIYPNRIALVYETTAPPRTIQPVSKSIIGTYKTKAEDWKYPHELPVFVEAKALNHTAPWVYHSVDDPQFQIQLAYSANFETTESQASLLPAIMLFLLFGCAALTFLCVCLSRKGKPKKQQKQKKKQEELNSVMWSDEDGKHID